MRLIAVRYDRDDAVHFQRRHVLLRAIVGADTLRRWSLTIFIDVTLVISHAHPRSVAKVSIRGTVQCPTMHTSSIHTPRLYHGTIDERLGNFTFVTIYASPSSPMSCSRFVLL